MEHFGGDLIAHVALQLISEADLQQPLVRLALEEALRVAEEAAHVEARLLRLLRVVHHVVERVQVLTPTDLVWVAVGGDAADGALCAGKIDSPQEDGKHEENILRPVGGNDGRHSTDDLHDGHQQRGCIDFARLVLVIDGEVAHARVAAGPGLLAPDVNLWDLQVIGECLQFAVGQAMPTAVGTHMSVGYRRCVAVDTACAPWFVVRGVLIHEVEQGRLERAAVPSTLRDPNGR